jgi:hypothetical protein
MQSFQKSPLNDLVVAGIALSDRNTHPWASGPDDWKLEARDHRPVPGPYLGGAISSSLHVAHQQLGVLVPW